MMYEIQFKPRSEDEDGMTMFVTEAQAESIKELQVKGSFGTWIGKEYIAFSSIRRITPSTYQPPSMTPVSDLLALPDEKEEDTKVRVQQNLDRLRNQVGAILRGGDKPPSKES